MTTRLFSLLFALIALSPFTASAEIVDISDADLADVVYSSDVPVVIDCWAPWCGPCRMMAPEFDKAAEEFEGQVKFCKYNVDHNSKLSHKHDIRGIPTILFYNAKEADQDEAEFNSKEVGYKKAAAIIELVRSKFSL